MAGRKAALGFLGVAVLLRCCPQSASALCLFNCFAPEEPQQPTNMSYTLNDYGGRLHGIWGACLGELPG